MRVLLWRSIYLCTLLLVSTLLAGAQGAPVEVSLVRKDRLPELPGPVSSYALHLLPATESRFFLTRELTDRSLPGGRNPVNYWSCGWNTVPLGEPVAETGIAGSGDQGTDVTGTYTALILSTPAPAKPEGEDALLIFRDLLPVARFRLPLPGAWIANVAADGQVVCRREGAPGAAYCYAPGKEPFTRMYPGTFLNWDFFHGWGIYAIDRKVVVVSGAQQTIFTVMLPFIVKKATPFEDGSILFGSQAIGENGPSWRVLLNPQGKVCGEAVFGEWTLLPSAWPTVKEMPLAGERKKRLPSPFLAVLSAEKVEFRYKGSLLPANTHPASNAYPPSTCFDAQRNLYTLVNRDVKREDGQVISEQSVVRTRIFPVAGEAPRALVSGAEVARTLGWESAFLYAMTLSIDGNWLAITVTPNDERSYREWWLLQYALTSPEPQDP